MGFLKNICLLLIIILTLSSEGFAFDSGEHKLIGNEGFDMVNPDNENKEFKCLSNKDYFTYGDIVALGGDFYGTPEDLILSKNIFHNFNSTGKDIKECFDKEIESIRCGKYTETTEVKCIMLKTDYPDLARNNCSHFSWHNIRRYVKYHEKALKFAQLAYYKCNGDEASFDKLLETLEYNKENIVNRWVSYIKSYFSSEIGELSKENLRRFNQQQWKSLMIYTNAFADHFLTDAFSAGHLRVPRKQIDAYAENPEEYLNSTGTTKWAEDDIPRSLKSGLYTLYLHNLEGGEGNNNGIPVVNAKGDNFSIKGDKRLFENVSGKLEYEKNEQFTMAAQAVRKSVEELYQVYKSGVEITELYEATKFVPFPVPNADSLVEVVKADGISKDGGKPVTEFERRRKIGALMNILYDHVNIDNHRKAFEAFKLKCTEHKETLNKFFDDPSNLSLVFNKSNEFKEKLNGMMKKLGSWGNKFEESLSEDIFRNFLLEPALADAAPKTRETFCEFISKQTWDDILGLEYKTPFSQFLDDFPKIMSKFPLDVANDIEHEMTASEKNHIAKEYLEAMQKIK